MRWIAADGLPFECIKQYLIGDALAGVRYLPYILFACDIPSIFLILYSIHFIYAAWCFLAYPKYRLTINYTNCVLCIGIFFTNIYPEPYAACTFYIIYQRYLHSCNSCQWTFHCSKLSPLDKLVYLWWYNDVHYFVCFVFLSLMLTRLMSVAFQVFIAFLKMENVMDKFDGDFQSVGLVAFCAHIPLLMRTKMKDVLLGLYEHSKQKKKRMKNRCSWFDTDLSRKIKQQHQQ